jgi:hypothetical protein
MLSIKSVAATPLSAAAKASIINTIADSALASFVVIQVGSYAARFPHTSELALQQCWLATAMPKRQVL